MTKGPAYRLGSQTGAIFRHLAKFRKILSPPRCAAASVRRPIVAPKRWVIEPGILMGGSCVFTPPAKADR
jgi:hypothetical protein